MAADHRHQDRENRRHRAAAAPPPDRRRKSNTLRSNAQDIGGTIPTATVANPRRRYLTMASRSIAKPIALRTSRLLQHRIALVQTDVGVVGAGR